MKNLKSLFSQFRIILLIVALVLAIMAISWHPGNTGVAIKNVVKGSVAYDKGMRGPEPGTSPTQYERILKMNGKTISDVEDYYDIVNSLNINDTLYIETNKGEYMLTIRPKIVTDVLPEQEEKVVPKVIEVNKTMNGTIVKVNETVNETVLVNKTVDHVVGPEPIGLFVEDASKTNIRLGLDLQGGTRVLLEPEKQVSLDELEIIRTSMEQRLNVYGLSNVIPRIIYDRPKALGGRPKYISVEIAGANIQEVKDLLAKQGKFEAKIGDDVVFVGGRDIKHVCRSSECSGLHPRRPPTLLENGTWSASFWFTISISPEAAQRQADVTKKLSVVTTGENGVILSPEEQYLNETIDLYLDDELIDSLNIGKSLQGNPVTDIQISGSGMGKTREEAIQNALEQMKKLQTVLITGSLPIKMNIVKADNVSPVLGHEFLKNAILVGFLAILTVVLIVFFIYREFKISVPMIITMISEVILILGMAALVKWDLDLAAIAGIIIAVGTGVDDQIVITDEVLEGKKRMLTWGERIKRAFFIVMNSYFTTVIAMIPLLWGAGLLRGFALTTIAGVTFGVFITRQAFAAMIEWAIKE